MIENNFTYAFEESVDEATQKILITIPGRWGRMPPLSRAVVVEAGKILRHANLLKKGASQLDAGRTIGLIGGTKWGSLTTDLDFADSLKENISHASPALFGYTLANIPLAEAANHFGLTGPVYALIEQNTPLKSALNEAKTLLNTQKELDLMLACEFDSYYYTDKEEQLSVTFTLLKKND